MAKKKTSKQLASLAGKVLQDPDARPEKKQLAGSVLSQRERRRSKAPQPDNRSSDTSSGSTS